MVPFACKARTADPAGFAGSGGVFLRAIAETLTAGIRAVEGTRKGTFNFSQSRKVESPISCSHFEKGDSTFRKAEK
jgi:hypothetical protein